MLFDDRHWCLGVPALLLLLAGAAACVGLCLAALGLIHITWIAGQSPLALFAQGAVGLAVCIALSWLLIGAMRTARDHVRLRLAAMNGAADAVPRARLPLVANNSEPKRLLIEERKPLDIAWGRVRLPFHRRPLNSYGETGLPFWAQSALQGSAIAVLLFEGLLVLLSAIGLLLLSGVFIWSLALLAAYLLALAPDPLGAMAATYAPASTDLPDVLFFVGLGVFVLLVAHLLLHSCVYRITATAEGVTRREWWGRRRTIRWADARHFEVMSRRDSQSADRRIRIYRLYSRHRMIWWNDGSPQQQRRWQVQSLLNCVEARTGLALCTFEPALMQSPPPASPARRRARGQRAHPAHRVTTPRFQLQFQFQWHVAPEQRLWRIERAALRRRNSRASYAVAFTLAIICQLLVTAATGDHPPATSASINRWLETLLALTALAFALGWLGVTIYTLAKPFIRAHHARRRTQTQAEEVASPSLTEAGVYEFRQRMAWRARILWMLTGVLLLLDAVPWLLWVGDMVLLHQAAHAHITRAFLVYSAVLLALPVCIGGVLFVSALIAAPTVVRADDEGLSLWHGRRRRAFISWERVLASTLLYRYDVPLRYRVIGQGKTISWPATAATSRQRQTGHKHRDVQSVTPAGLAAVIAARTGQQTRIWQLGAEG